MNNVTTLKGNIGSIKSIEGSNGEFLAIRLAVTESRGKDAEPKQDWYDLVAFNGAKEQIEADGLKVGDFVEFSGALELRDRTIGDVNVKQAQVRIRKHTLLKAAGEKTEGEAA
jgi:hypothetical protein